MPLPKQTEAAMKSLLGDIRDAAGVGVLLTGIYLIVMAFGG